MSRGERAAVEGVLASLRPTLAIEIGSMEGAGLRRIAAYSEAVHSFDLEPPTLLQPGNVTLHTGDSHALLPQFLGQLAGLGGNVDLAIVDGDHSPQGVRQDLEDLLDSTAVRRTVILIHDTANERVREGIDRVRFAAWPKVAHVELDWIPGQLFADPALRNELWYGLGLVLVDSARIAYGSDPVYEQRYHPAAPLLAHARELILEREQAPGSLGPDDLGRVLRNRIHELDRELVAGLRREAELSADLMAGLRREAELSAELMAGLRREAELSADLMALQHRIERAERTLQNVIGSASWRLTEPLRAAKRQAGRAKGQ